MASLHPTQRRLAAIELTVRVDGGRVVHDPDCPAGRHHPARTVTVETFRSMAFGCARCRAINTAADLTSAFKMGGQASATTWVVPVSVRGSRASVAGQISGRLRTWTSWHPLAPSPTDPGQLASAAFDSIGILPTGVTRLAGAGPVEGAVSDELAPWVAAVVCADELLFVDSITPSMFGAASIAAAQHWDAARCRTFAQLQRLGRRNHERIAIRSGRQPAAQGRAVAESIASMLLARIRNDSRGFFAVADAALALLAEDEVSLDDALTLAGAVGT